MAYYTRNLLCPAQPDLHLSRTHHRWNQQAGDQLHHDQGEGSRDQIVGEDAPAGGEVLGLIDRGGLQDVEPPETGEGAQREHDVVHHRAAGFRGSPRQEQQRQTLARHFVRDDLAGILAGELAFGPIAEGHADDREDDADADEDRIEGEAGADEPEQDQHEGHRGH